MNDEPETKKEWETPVIIDFKEIGETSSLKPTASIIEGTSVTGHYSFGPS